MKNLNKITYKLIFIMFLSITCIFLSSIIEEQLQSRILLSIGFLLLGWAGFRKPGDVSLDSIRPIRDNNDDITPVERKKNKQN